jgi:selenide,water dikinase
MDGARSICEKAGIVISGGHTIDAPEPFFGLSVNGLAQIQHIKQNNTAQDGDVILLSKPIGVGILATAQKRGVILEDHQAILVDQLIALNSFGELLGKEKCVHAMTDVTGFGLLGHLVEMSEGSGLTANIDYGLIPKLQTAIDYAKQGIVPDATYRNWNAYSEKVNIAASVDAMEAFTLLPDPQTNGGLLVAVDRKHVDEIIHLGLEHNTTLTAIGSFIPQQNPIILIS